MTFPPSDPNRCQTLAEQKTNDAFFIYGQKPSFLATVRGYALLVAVAASNFPAVFLTASPRPLSQGHWTAREEGAGSRGEGKIVWSNDECLCEMVLTTEGMYFIGSDARFLYRMKPQSVRVEYGLAGCNEGMSTLFKLSNVHARARLGFPGPSEVMRLVTLVRPRAVEGCGLPLDDSLSAMQVRGEGAVVDALRNWTAVNGWHRLRERLFDQGRNCHEVTIPCCK